MSQRVSKYLKCRYQVLSLLNKPCLELTQLHRIHSHLVISGFISDPFAAGKLISHLVSFDHSHAYAVFHRLPHKSTYLWNTIIRSFVENKDSENALSVYNVMLSCGFFPNNYTFSFVIRGCIDTANVGFGLLCHAQVIKLGWECYDFVQNGLIHFYVNCGLMRCARMLFDVSLNRDVVTWTAVLNGYVKCGDIVSAKELFDEMPERNVISWSVMINGYVKVGCFKEALEIFNEMQRSRVRPNHAGIVGALSACGSLGALDQGKWIHAFVDRSKMELDTVLGTALIDMYAKCGSVEVACRVFEEMPNRDVYAFTSLISGLSNHGDSVMAVELLKRMGDVGIKPNEVTFICILSACARVGLVDEGLRVFESMNDIYGIKPGVEHYGCLVDLLGRAGLLEQAKKVVRDMPMEPDIYVLGALLNACRVHGDADLGNEMVEGLVNRSLDHSGVHVLLSNIYASANQWDHVERIRKVMVEKEVKKVPGCSLIEIDGGVVEFIAGNRCHPLIKEIELLWVQSDMHLKSLSLDTDVLLI
ncbi:pentatricopeptide repeat-containing protein At5g66520-like [Apium graveolens]|uniref:pentatricopeptide repeat-containing protein At5g66520-like n=1 Tax=Apium graveolens TaxID=4045 RepID=UPI003D79BED3